MHVFRWLLALLLTGLFAVPLAAAEPGASAWVNNEAGAVRLVSAVSATGPLTQLRLGLQFQLADGWKIYWRTPGQVGLPPHLDTSGSDNLGPLDLSWPMPHRTVSGDIQTYGYDGTVILPIEAAVLRPGEPVQIRAQLDYLACSDLCVPMQVPLALDLPAGEALLSPHAHEIERFRALVPGDGSRHGLRLERAEALSDGSVRVSVVSTTATPFLAPELLIEGADGADFTAPQVHLEEGGLKAVLVSAPVEKVPSPRLAGAMVRLTFGDGPRLMDSKTTLQPAGTGGDLLLILAIAVLGGLILNVMPCVLPVLSIKILALLGQSGESPRQVRFSFLASAAGILTSFWVLAGAAVAFKIAGSAVGWGIQFQQPVFLAAMAAVMGLFAANLLGLFEFRVPSGLMMIGGDRLSKDSPAGHFLSGAFATLLATPCSAPFLGTAVGFALARGPVEIFAVFTALGLGMSVPYLLVAGWPSLATRLPRPGRWMIRVRQGLGVAAGLTALWLLTVLATQVGWVRSVAEPGGAVVWRPFDRNAIPALVAEGKTVFVDVTADWCLTCKLNKANVVEREPVAGRLAATEVVAMRADWTVPNDAVTRYLSDHGRYGIPFNVVYGPKAPMGLPLSELLTTEETLRALDRAAP